VKVAILGAGSWGSALAIHLTRAGQEVALWSRDSKVADAIRREGRHPTRLHGAEIPATIGVRTGLADTLVDLGGASATACWAASRCHVIPNAVLVARS